MRLFFILILMVSIISTINAQQWEWAQSYGGTGVDLIASLSINNDNDELLFSGTFHETIDFSLSSVSALQGSDAFLAKSDLEGNVIWSVSAGSLNNDFSLDTEIDKDGNILWLGQYWVEAFFENDTIQSGSNTKAYFVAKYNPDGQLIWVRSITGSATKVVNDLSLDAEDNIYLTGYFNDSLMVEDLVLIAQGGEDAFVLKMESNGNPSWGMRYGNSGTIRPKKIETTSSGKIIIAGDLTGNVTFGSDVLNSVTTDFDIFIAQLDENGVALWGKIGTGVYDNFVNALAIDESDHIYVSGNFTAVLGIGNQSISTPGFNENLYLLKLSSSGELIWVRGLSNTEFNDPSFAYDITLKEDLVLMTGQFIGDLLIDNLSLGHYDILQGFIASFDGADGNVKKLSVIPGTAQTSGRRIMVGSEGRIYVAGTFLDQVNFDDITLSTEGMVDFFIAGASPTFTGLENLLPQYQALSLFPNPVYESFVLEAPEEDFRIEIFMLNGLLIMQAKNQISYNVGHLVPGKYFIRYTSAKGIRVSSFVKM